MAVYKDAIARMEGKMSKDAIARVNQRVEEETVNIKLKMLREERNLTQNDLPIFSQSSVAHMESRKNIRISSLINYLKDIGMGFEMKVFPLNSPKKTKTILRVG